MTIKNIVVIGGGYAGIAILLELQKQLTEDQVKITLIEKSNYFYHCVGTPRALIDSTFSDKLCIPYDKAFKPSIITRIEGYANRIKLNQVHVQLIKNEKLTDENIQISFDYLVIATGSEYKLFKKKIDLSSNKKDQLEEIKRAEIAIKEAKRILIIGGGPVGIEVAGEIASLYTDKKVILLDSKEKLLLNYNLVNKFKDKLVDKLKKLNVALFLNDRPAANIYENSYENKTIVTKGGREIQSDIQLFCGGDTLNNTTKLIETLDSTILNDKKAIRVKDTLQVDDEKYSHIYAIGDVSNHKSPKLAYIAAEQGKYVAKSIVKRIKENGLNSFPGFTAGNTEAMIIPLGKNDGIGQLPFFGGCVVGAFMVRNIKGKDYFLSKYWKELNAS